MYTPGFTVEEVRQFENRLFRDHQIRIRVDMLDLNMNPAPNISDLTPYLLDGQLTVSAAADVSTRTLTASFLDPNAELGLDTGDPDDGIMYADRMLRIWYGVYVPEVSRLDKWMEIPIFTGPIVKFDRSESGIAIECAGKEVLAGEVWETYTIPKGTNKIEAIKMILRKGGENFFGNLGGTASVLGADIVGVRTPTTSSTNSSKSNDKPEGTVMWSQAEDIAQGMGKYLFYDGMGYVQMRDFPETSTFTFKDGDGGSVLKEPQITFDPSLLKNVVRVEGKQPSKGSAPVATAIAGSGHPLSPWILGRMVSPNGTIGNEVMVPRYLPEYIQSDKYTSTAACQSAADQALKERLDQSIELNFDTLVVPHVEMNGYYTLSTSRPAIETTFRMRNYSIPLNASGVMTVGYTKNQIINRMAIRNRVLT
jgi:hypothetical protein